MKEFSRFTFFVMFILSTNLQAQYQPTWESLDQRETPQWWKDAKFGIFIHWGVYSVPAYAPVDEVEGVYSKYAEHYARRLQEKDSLFTSYHNKIYGPEITYRDFAQMFKAEHFDPDDWADLFQRSGAKYVVLTSKHHDGFALWDSKYSPSWNSVKTGPNRNIIKELSEAVRKKSLRMGLYYSLLEWDNSLYNPNTIDEWVDTHMIPQMKELVLEYQPEIIFADGEWDYTSDRLKSEEFLAWLYNDSPVKKSVVVNDRWGKETRSKHGGYYTTEYDLVGDIEGIGDAAGHPWEESRGIGTSYGYNRFENMNHYFTSQQLVHLLIEKVSNGGNLLLNIGPRADGTIPVIMQERLLDIGKWLKVNGEAIYGSSVWEEKPFVKENTGIFYTLKDNDLYVICTQWPSSPLIVKGLNKVDKVNMLGLDEELTVTLQDGELMIVPPDCHPGKLPSEYAWVFKVHNVNFMTH